MTDDAGSGDRPRGSDPSGVGRETAPQGAGAQAGSRPHPGERPGGVTIPIWALQLSWAEVRCLRDAAEYANASLDEPEPVTAQAIAKLARWDDWFRERVENAIAEKQRSQPHRGQRV